jgi:hypothetical protein
VLDKAKVHYSKPMSTGDSTLMMLLSLNLLLLVFFMMLNSMATYGAKHAEDVLAQVRAGYNVPSPHGKQGDGDVTEVPFASWRNGLVGRMQGMVMNRIDLRVLPQEGSAGKVEIEMPMGSIFAPDGTVNHPETVKNMMAAAGSESKVIWQVKADWTQPEKFSRYAGSLAAQGVHVRVVGDKDQGLRVIVVPGSGTKSAMGLQVQAVGEDAGGMVKGVETKGTDGE